MANEIPPIYAREHSPIDFGGNPGLRERVSAFAATGNFNTNKTLGLHYTQGGICPGNFIGAVRIGAGEPRAVLRVHSKFDNPQMDYIKMFAECCEDAVIGGYMHNCFECWPEKELVQLQDADDFSILIIVSYLRELNSLCVRHLRRHFVRQRENFTGKVRGKIIIGENIRRNAARGRIDRVFCEYQAISDDILENRILRAALEKAARYVAENKTIEKYEILHRWIHACRARLHSVPVAHISRRDFPATRKRGTFAFYRRPLGLAKAVLLRFGLNPNERSFKLTQTPQYAVNSAELFERYAQLQLLKEYPGLVALYQKQNIKSDIKNGFNVGVRPDFYIPRAGGNGEAWIIDAKYKKLSNEYKDEKFSSNEDFYQVVSYSRHRGVLEKLDEKIGEETTAGAVNLWLVYPSESPDKQKGEIRECLLTKAFALPVKIVEISCPVKPAAPSE